MAPITTDVDLSRVLSELKTSADRLNVSTDVINAALQSAESQIRDMNIGLECWPVDCEIDRQWSTINCHSFEATYLGFARISKSWSFAVRTRSGFDNGEDFPRDYRIAWAAEGEPSPLLKASRLVRVAALEKLPLLIGALKALADEATVPVQQAAEKIEGSRSREQTETVEHRASKRVRRVPGRRAITELRPRIEERYPDQIRKQIQGHITSYIARENDEPERLVKTIRTLMKQCEMDREELVRLFDEIYQGAVRAFLEAPSGTTFGQQGPARNERFDRLKTALLI
jgi:hypothetical protein